MRKYTLIFLIVAISLVACNQRTVKDIPVINPLAERGEEYMIPAFNYTNQDGNTITEELIKDKIYVADFFFTTCPDICPKMSQQMMRLHDEFIDENELLLLSHSLDPAYDTVAVLKAYADGLGAKTDKWHLLTTPDEDYVYETCQGYLLSASIDESLVGGIAHSGKFVLIDRKRRIRGFYEGTNPEEVDKLIIDIGLLLNEKP